MAWEAAEVGKEVACVVKALGVGEMAGSVMEAGAGVGMEVAGWEEEARVVVGKEVAGSAAAGLGVAGFGVADLVVG